MCGGVNGMNENGLEKPKKALEINKKSI